MPTIGYILGAVLGFYFMIYGNALLRPETKKLIDKKRRQDEIAQQRQAGIAEEPLEGEAYRQEIRRRVRRSRRDKVKGYVFLVVGFLLFAVTIYQLLKITSAQP